MVAFARMDGAQLASIAIAEHKARAAVMSRRETKVYESGVQSGMTYLLSLDGMIGSRGGIPLVEDGKIIGAVGASAVPARRMRCAPRRARRWSTSRIVGAR